MSIISFSQCLAENIKLCCAELIPYIECKTGIMIDYNPNIEFEKRRENIVSGETQVTWICGLLYTQLRDKEGASLRPLVAPIAEGDTQPSYSSYLVAQKDSIYNSEEDLNGAVLAFNEESSFSGYHLLRYHFRESDIRFSRLVESGGHQKSIDLLNNGKADVAGIDTTFYDYLYREKPEQIASLQIIKKLDAFPMPPLLVNTAIDVEIESKLKQCLLALSEEGKALLARHGFTTFVAVDDGYYHAIRQAIELGQDLKVVS